jgi:hypothetical protein
METLRADFLRFSRLHSWYKHIHVDGADFYAFQAVGEQPRNGVHPNVTDLSGIHWHFLRTVPEKTPYYKARFGPFLHGIYESDCWGKHVFSFNLILDCNKETFLSWISNNYPEYAYLTLSDWEGKCREWNDPIVVDLFEKETTKYWVSLIDAIGPDLLNDSIDPLIGN